MKQSIILALSATILASIASAKPMVHQHLHRRDLVTTTVWEDVTTTIDLIVTVYGSSPGNDKQTDPQLHEDNAVHRKPADQPAPQATPQSLPKVENKKVENSNPLTQVPAQTSAPVKPSQAQDYQPPPQDQQQQQQQQQSSSQQSEQPQPSTSSNPLPSNGGGESGPSGGACGSVGGKCIAPSVTIYNDQDTFGEFTNDVPGTRKNAFCGRMAAISVKGGAPVEGMLTDKCADCKGWDIDLSHSLWQKVFPGMDYTRVNNIEWWFTGPEVYHGPSG
ncbi:MAG: hypothetical protein Q9217_000366 [Psora testacea]